MAVRTKSSLADDPNPLDLGGPNIHPLTSLPTPARSNYIDTNSISAEHTVQPRILIADKSNHMPTPVKNKTTSKTAGASQDSPRTPIAVIRRHNSRGDLYCTNLPTTPKLPHATRTLLQASSEETAFVDTAFCDTDHSTCSGGLCCSNVDNEQELNVDPRKLQGTSDFPRQVLPRSLAHTPSTPYTSGLRSVAAPTIGGGLVGGALLRLGELLLMDDGGSSMDPWTILLFSSGFYAVARNSGAVRAYTWSPFSVLSKSPTCMCDGDSELHVFTLSVPADGGHLLLGSTGPGANIRREQWLRDMSMSLGSFTRSLFPPFALAVEPLEDVPGTSLRILAGYLLLRGISASEISVPYCELQAHFQGSAFLQMYDSENCRQRVGGITITCDTRLFEREGVHCSSFSVSGRMFCARSTNERQLWLRALGNIKVKLRNHAPDPSEADLRCFRKAVLDRLIELQVGEAPGCLGSMAVGGNGHTAEHCADYGGVGIGSVSSVTTTVDGIGDNNECGVNAILFDTDDVGIDDIEIHDTAAPVATVPLPGDAPLWPVPLHEIIGDAWFVEPGWADNDDDDFGMLTPEDFPDKEYPDDCDYNNQETQAPVPPELAPSLASSSPEPLLAVIANNIDGTDGTGDACAGNPCGQVLDAQPLPASRCYQSKSTWVSL